MTTPDENNVVLILFAEDDDDDFLLLEEALDDAGISNAYERVTDGSSLLARLRDPGKPRPDVVLLDLNMEPVGGIPALTEIRGDPELRDLDVVVLTTSPAEEERCRKIGVRDYHIKPVLHTEMVDIFVNVLEYSFVSNRVRAAK